MEYLILFKKILFKNWFKNKRSRVMADTKQISPVTTSNHFQANLNQINLNKSINQTVLNVQKQASINLQDEPKEEVNNSQKISDLINSNNCTIPINRSNISSSNKNLNGLLNIVQSIRSNEISKKPIGFSKEPKKENQIKNDKDIDSYLNYCFNCLRSNRVLCSCNISKLALSKLYKYSIGFNSTQEFSTNRSFVNQSRNLNICRQSDYNEKYYFVYEYCETNKSSEEVGKEKVFFAL